MCKIDRLEAIDFTESEFPSLSVGGYFGLNGVFAGMEGTFKADVLPLKMARILSSESTSVSAFALSIHCSGSDRKA